MKIKLLIVMMVTLCCASLAAASGARLDLGAPSARSGNTVTVPLVLTGAAPIASLSTDIGFDPASVSVEMAATPPMTRAAQPGPAAQAAGKVVVQGLAAPGLLRIGVFDTAKGAVIGSGVVAYVTFQLKPGSRLVLTNKPGASDAQGQEIAISGAGLDTN